MAQSGVVHVLERRLSIGGRILAFIGVSWVPVAILDGLFGAGLLISKPWVHIPLLIVGPLLIFAESPIEKRVRMAIEQLETRETFQDPHRLEAVLERGTRALSGRLGIIVEIMILAYVVFATVLALDGLDPRRAGGLGITGGPSLTAAQWFEWVSLPLLLFLRLRWVWRFIVWVQTLWRLSHLPMTIYPTHSDQKGGLAILGRAQESFGALWLAISALASTTIVHHVSLGEKTLQDYYAVVPTLIVLEVLITLLPLAFFVRVLKAAQIRGMAEYESLSSRYSRDFDSRWMEASTVNQEGMLGNADFQSLADLGNGYDRISKMGVFPTKVNSAKRLAALGALPFIPLVLLVFPVEQLAKAAIQLIL
jgi:hypothetical protein